MINENQIRQMDPITRSHFRDIPDSYFKDNKDVIAKRKHIAELEAAHLVRVAEITKLNRIVALQNEVRDIALKDAAALEAGRPSAIVNVLIEDGNVLIVDGEIKEEIQLNLHLAEVIKLAEPEFQKRIMAASNYAGHTAKTVEGATDSLRDLLDSLRLSEAKSRAA